MPFLAKNLDRFLESSCADVYCKNKKGAYLDVNNRFLEICELNSVNDVQGKTDLDLVWKIDAPQMMQNDQEVIKKNIKKIVIERTTRSDIIEFYLSHKTPLFSKTNKIIGIFGVSYLITHNDTLSESLHDLADLYDHYETKKQLKKHALLMKFKKYNLTQQQTKCMQQLILGKTIKEIAQNLGLSPRTVEHYLEAVKIKFHCTSVRQLIQKCLEWDL